MSEPQEPDISDLVDELPEDLDRTFASPYEFPDNNRRRIPAVMYMVIGAGAVVLWLVRGDGVLVNNGIGVVGVLLILFGIYQFISGVSLQVDENKALLVATQHVDFAVGHASGQLSWRGLLSRPTWRMLLYSAEEPPTHRALVRVDGVTADVVDALIEDNPEEWDSTE